MQRERDCIVLLKGDAYAVAIDPVLAVQGWNGGQGVQWVTPATGDLPTVTRSTGYGAGFALWGSDESSDRYVSSFRQYPSYRYLVLGVGGWLISTTSYERYTYASRSGMGPLVPLVYQASERLVLSLRGYWTKEDEWTLSGDPRAPNTFYLGFVAQVPSSATSDYMTIQADI